MLRRLTHTWFCFIYGTVPLAFICDYRKCRRLSEPFFFLVKVTLLFHVWTVTRILQFPSETVQFNFVWLPHDALSLTTNHLVSFYFIHYPYFLWTATTFRLSFWVELSHLSLCECHTNILRVSIIFAWMSHMRVSIFLCEVTQISLCLHYF